jgi:hypothetical protein
MDTSTIKSQLVQSDGGVYFEIKDPIYIDNLKKKLHKLRRYRWIYHRSSENYEYIYDYYIFYPQLILGIIVAILSMLAASNQTNNGTKNVLNYIIAGIGFITTAIQTLLVKKRFNEKYVKFSTAAKELDKLIIRVSNEVSFNDEDPIVFVKFIESALKKIKADLDLNPPMRISMEYDRIARQNPSDIASENETLPGPHTKKKRLAISKKTCYDYDIEDDLKAQKQYEETQNTVMSNPSTYIRTFVPNTNINNVNNKFSQQNIYKPESVPSNLRQKTYVYTTPHIFNQAEQFNPENITIQSEHTNDKEFNDQVKIDLHLNNEDDEDDEDTLNFENKSNLSVESTIEDSSIRTI